MAQQVVNIAGIKLDIYFFRLQRGSGRPAEDVFAGVRGQEPFAAAAQISVISVFGGDVLDIDVDFQVAIFARTAGVDGGGPRFMELDGPGAEDAILLSGIQGPPAGFRHKAAFSYVVHKELAAIAGGGAELRYAPFDFICHDT